MREEGRHRPRGAIVRIGTDGAEASHARSFRCRAPTYDLTIQPYALVQLKGRRRARRIIIPTSLEFPIHYQKKLGQLQAGPGPLVNTPILRAHTTSEQPPQGVRQKHAKPGAHAARRAGGGSAEPLARPPTHIPLPNARHDKKSSPKGRASFEASLSLGSSSRLGAGRGEVARQGGRISRRGAEGNGASLRRRALRRRGRRGAGERVVV